MEAQRNAKFLAFGQFFGPQIRRINTDWKAGALGSPLPAESALAEKAGRLLFVHGWTQIDTDLRQQAAFHA
jgi:hypothetical protein